MGLDLVIGHKGEDHITAGDVAGLLKDIIGKDNYIFKLPVIETSLDQNQVTVTLAEGGSYSLQGRYIIDDYATETLTVAGVTTSGRYRRDAIIIRFNRTNNVESAEYAIKTGTESWIEESANPPVISSPSPESANTSEMIIGYVLVSYTDAEYEPLLSRRTYQKQLKSAPLSIQTDRFSEVMRHLTIPGSLLHIEEGSEHYVVGEQPLCGLDKNQEFWITFDREHSNLLIAHYNPRFIKSNGWTITKSYSASVATYYATLEEDKFYGISAKIVFDIDKFLQYFDETTPESGHNPINSINLFFSKYTKGLLTSDITTVPQLEYDTTSPETVALNRAYAVYSDTTFKGTVTINVILSIFQVVNGTVPYVKEYYKLGDDVLNYMNSFYDLLSLNQSVMSYDSTYSQQEVTLTNKTVIGVFIDGVPKVCTVKKIGNGNTKLTLPTISSGKTCYVYSYDTTPGQLDVMSNMIEAS